MADNEFETNASSNYSVNLEVPKKKRKKGNILGIVILVIILAVAAVFLVLGTGKTLNLFHMTFGSTESYYDWLEENNTDMLLGMLLPNEKEQKTQVTMDVTLGEGTKLPIAKPITLNLTANQKGDVLSAQGNLEYEKKAFLDLNMLYDFGSSKAYVNIPALSEDYLVENIAGQVLENAEAEVNLKLDAKDRSKLRRLVAKYVNRWIHSSTKEIVMEKNQEFTFEDTTIKGTKITAQINLRDSMACLKSVLDAAKIDEDLFELLEKDGLKKSEFKSIMNTMIDKASTLSTSYLPADNAVMTCYVDESGRIIARDIHADIKITSYDFTYLISPEKDNNKVLISAAKAKENLAKIECEITTSKKADKVTAIEDIKALESKDFLAGIGREHISNLVDSMLAPFQLSQMTDYVTGMLTNLIAGNSNSTPLGDKTEFTLGEYKGIHVQQLSVDVTDDDMNSQMVDFVNYYSDMLPITDRDDVQDKDYVNIDYEGRVDGKVFTGGSATGSELEIGSGQFVDTFEQQLIGSKIGDTVTVNVTFPADYYNTEVAGKAAVFTVKINAIGARELTDEFIQYNTDYKTVDEYTQVIYDDLCKKKEEDAISDVKDQIMDAIIANSTFISLNQSEVEAHKKEMLDTYEQYAQYYSLTLEEYVKQMFNLNMDEFNEEIDYWSEYYVKESYILAQIAEDESLALTQEEYEKRRDDIVTEYEYSSAAELEDANGGAEALKEILLEDKIQEYLMDVSVIEK